MSGDQQRDINKFKKSWSHEETNGNSFSHFFLDSFTPIYALNLCSCSPQASFSVMRREKVISASPGWGVPSAICLSLWLCPFISFFPLPMAKDLWDQAPRLVPHLKPLFLQDAFRRINI